MFVLDMAGQTRLISLGHLTIHDVDRAVRQSRLLDSVNIYWATRNLTLNLCLGLFCADLDG